jgi:DNA-directed RNA polymerase subunit RPC12/RpoP
VFVCPRCGRRVVKVYDHTGGLACKKCHNAIQLSQKLDKRTRPVLKAHRLEQFLALKTNINQRTRERLIKRFGEKAMRPQSNYRTRGPVHWK